MQDFSQHSEQAIIAQIFDHIGTTNKYCVEFGAGDGYKNSNTRKLLNDGWQGLLMDCDPTEGSSVLKEFITRENINDLFTKYEVPPDFDFLSIDIDGNDYWVWKALEWRPRVVCIEYNSQFPESLAIVMQYNAEHQWANDTYYGASFEALKRLGASKGYKVVHLTPTNIFFMLQEISYPEYPIKYERRDVHASPANIENCPYIYFT